MTFDDLDDVFWIDDAETMEMLADGTRLEIIENLYQPRSVTELAAAMEVPRTRLYHHVNLLEQAGLITVFERREVGAITETVYRVAAKNFQPSQKFLDEVDPSDQAVAILDSLFASTKADIVRAVRTEEMTLDEARVRRYASMGRRLTRLTPTRLGELVTELEALLQRFDVEDEDPEAITVGVLHVVYPSSRRLDA